jgi:peptidoglycan-N-acetylglucosamine deacetylase
MKISVLIPCHNEEKTIAQCIDSCLNQTRKPDQIVVVNDGSTDNTSKILRSFGKKIKVVTLRKNTGNKSFVQEVGLSYITGEVFVITDADTIVHKNFFARVEKAFKNKKVAAFSGYVKSLEHNWLTACREIEYIIAQNIHKQAQSYINALYVIPGCAGAFRTKVFRKYLAFEHDTLTEDLDVTYKLHKNNLKIVYDKKAIVYTQDPATLKCYLKQIRRWASGGWQNVVKHRNIVKRPQNLLEMTIVQGEGLVFSILLFVTPILNPRLFLSICIPYLVLVYVFTLYAAMKDKREDLALYFPCYVFLMFINAYVFLEQFIAVVLLRQKNLVWNTVERRAIV